MSTALITGVALAVLYVFFAKAFTRHKPLPGPPGVPLFGNVLQLRGRKLWEKLYEWGHDYGGIYSIRLFGTRCLVLNTVACAREILEGKSANYSNRPLPKMIELTGFDKGIVLEHDPNRLRHARRLLNTILTPRQISKYRDSLKQHIDVFLFNLSQEPDAFVQHIRHLTAGISMEMSHGHRVTTRYDPYVQKANIFADHFAEATLPNNHIVDWLPFLAYLPSWLPGMGFKNKARAWREQYVALAEEGHQVVKDQIAKGTARPSLTYYALAESEPGEHPDDIIMFTATQVYTGGTDTSVSILSSFILFMVKNPEVQKKGQEEIQRVIGSDRLPTYEDRASLPYVESIIIEVFRLRPPVSLVTRMATQDDMHNGCLIEANTAVIVNFWGMLRDEQFYPDPHSFKPERWIGQDSRSDVHPYNVAFGFGRRTCPGQNLGEELVFASAARMLALFNISPAQDANGKPIIPSDDSTHGGITFPIPFRCEIRPRTARTKEILQELVGQHDWSL